MTCQECDELIDLYAAGALDNDAPGAGERQRVRSHLATGCPQCSGRLAESEAVLARFALSTLAPGAKVPAGAKARLDALLDEETAEKAGLIIGVGAAEREGLTTEGRGNTDRRTHGADGPGPMAIGGAGARTGWRTWVFPASVAAVLAAAVTGGLMFTEVARLEKQSAGLISEAEAVRGAKDLADGELKTLEAAHEERGTQLVATTERLAASEKMLDEINRRLTEANTTLARLQGEKQGTDEQLVSVRTELAQTQLMLRSKQLVAIELKGQEASPDAQARLLVDLENKVWKLYASNLKPLEGRVYEFWLITAEGAKVPMGSFTPGAEGLGYLGDRVPVPTPKLVAAAITDEPGPGAREPTGKMHVVGQFN